MPRSRGFICCDHCRHSIDEHYLTYLRRSDEYVCDDCIPLLVSERKALEAKEPPTNE